MSLSSGCILDAFRLYDRKRHGIFRPIISVSALTTRGYITSMKNTTVSPNREFSPADKPSPLLSLYDSEKKVYYTPQKAIYNAEADCFYPRIPERFR